ncbi:uncharacterized protein LOC121712307 isoform X1 [Alosa sapidissima]|uniref:uncharacterized protein LOC121712307 isoform X1 n=2 Tax=Alosa sapidissima TaxID=34773 RepID=UPI001C07F3DD|nr:uncharacterized protein LOC121712307 isoform X1 [Alosa sapidissima]
MGWIDPVDYQSQRATFEFILDSLSLADYPATYFSIYFMLSQMQSPPSQSLLLQPRQMDFSLRKLFLLACVFYTEAKEDLYLLEGHHVKLDIQGHEQLRRENIDFVHWIFHKPLVRFYPVTERLFLLPDYRPNGTLEFDSRNFSMKLKNLQKNDSGLYRGEIGTEDKILVTEYSLSIQEPVSTPNLMVDSNWSSSDSCNVTLTCSGRDLSVTLICNGSTCMHEGGAFTDHKLIVIVRDDNILCNYSNQVSWSEAMLEMGEVCPFYIGQKKASSETEMSSWCLIGISCSAGLTVFTAFALLMLRTQRNKGGNATDYYSEVAHPPNQAEAQTLTHSSASSPSQHVLFKQPHQDEGFYSLLRL